MGERQCKVMSYSLFVGPTVGDRLLDVGSMDGDVDGYELGELDGAFEGMYDGILVGDGVYVSEGDNVGSGVTTCLIAYCIPSDGRSPDVSGI